VIVHDRTNLQTEESSENRAKQRNEMIPKFMNEALKINDKDQRALFNLGNFYLTQSDFKKALVYYKKCLKFTPSNDEKYFVLAQIGICHQLSGHELRAVWAFKDLEKLIPNRWETKRLIGGAYMQFEQWQKALPYLVESLESNKVQYFYQLFAQDFSEIWDLIANCFQELGQFPEAVVAWEEAQKESQTEDRKGFFATKSRLASLLCKNPDAELTKAEFDKARANLEKRGATSKI
jgi:tetratricopeptide (TPR) repeat protein